MTPREEELRTYLLDGLDTAEMRRFYADPTNDTTIIALAAPSDIGALCGSIDAIRDENARLKREIARLHARYERPDRPKVVTLCGSTRFYQAFMQANFDETMAGRKVFSVGFFPHSAEQAHGETIGITPEKKIELDELHKRKIDDADEIFVLNVGGYIGDSTRSEIAYARSLGIPVRWLEPDKATE